MTKVSLLPVVQLIEEERPSAAAATKHLGMPLLFGLFRIVASSIESEPVHSTRFTEKFSFILIVLKYVNSVHGVNMHASEQRSIK